MNLIRLDKYIASQTTFSRSESRKLITTGRVRVEGLNWVNADTKIDADEANVLVDGRPLNFKEFVYFIMNKPAGVLSACNDKSKKTVVDLIEGKYRCRNLFPVGRLDKDTTGLLIITDDGETAHKIISPKSKIPKKYFVKLDGELKESDILRFREGIILADGTKCAPAELEILPDNSAFITITEGKYHQVKRMFGVIDLGVVSLKRVSIGKLLLPEELLFGEYKEITFEKIEELILC